MTSKSKTKDTGYYENKFCFPNNSFMRNLKFMNLLAFLIKNGRYMIQKD